MKGPYSLFKMIEQGHTVNAFNIMAASFSASKEAVAWILRFFVVEIPCSYAYPESDSFTELTYEYCRGFALKSRKHGFTGLQSRYLFKVLLKLLSVSQDIGPEFQCIWGRKFRWTLPGILRGFFSKWKWITRVRVHCRFTCDVVIFHNKKLPIFLD